MVVAVDACIRAAAKVHEGPLINAKPMVVASTKAMEVSVVE